MGMLRVKNRGLRMKPLSNLYFQIGLMRHDLKHYKTELRKLTAEQKRAVTCLVAVYAWQLATRDKEASVTELVADATSQIRNDERFHQSFNTFLEKVDHPFEGPQTILPSIGEKQESW